MRRWAIALLFTFVASTAHAQIRIEGLSERPPDRISIFTVKDEGIQTPLISFQEIAREEGVAVSTVHHRIETGLERMRTDLDRTHGGDRRVWASALLPWARPKSGPAPVVSGGLAAGIGMKLFLAATAVGLAWGAWSLLGGGDAR